MKHSITIFLIVTAVSILSIGVFLYSQNLSSSTPKVREDKTEIKNDTAPGSDKSVEDKIARSRYVVYNKSVFSEAPTSRRVIFFYASWCPTCRPADLGFMQNASKIPDDVTLYRVNYNDSDTDQEEKDLARKYGVTYQHTFVQIDAQGKEVTKWVGGGIDELLANIQ